ncbi:MAG TPA: hypothetical protein VNP02_13215 [Gammaproteobacteria bacterium]|jgi:hypothetical protein|nr:hypothetical protein [Gammaproteobacteria bacterium]
MRASAPAIVGAAVVLAAALVWYLRPGTTPPFVPDGEASLPQPTPVAPARAAQAEPPAADAAQRSAARVVETGTSPARTLERAPLPGETPSTPMANLITERTRNVPPQMAEGEREFAAEPVDATWASGAEAKLLAKFAEMPNLKLIDLQVECRSTMCRLQLTQPSAPGGGPQPFNLLRDSTGLEPRWMIAIGGPGGSMKSVAYLWRDGFAGRDNFVPHFPGQARETN